MFLKTDLIKTNKNHDTFLKKNQKYQKITHSTAMHPCMHQLTTPLRFPRKFFHFIFLFQRSLTAPQPTLGYYQGKSLTHSKLVTGY